MRKSTDWQQTGFRANKILLNKFRSKLALEGRDMGSLLEKFIESYVDGGVLANESEMQTISTVGNHDIDFVLRHGGQAADLLLQTARTLRQLINDGRLNSDETGKDDRASNSGTDRKLEEAERRMAEIRAKENKVDPPQGGDNRPRKRSSR